MTHATNVINSDPPLTSIPWGSAGLKLNIHNAHNKHCWLLNQPSLPTCGPTGALATPIYSDRLLMKSFLCFRRPWVVRTMVCFRPSACQLNTIFQKLLGGISPNLRPWCIWRQKGLMRFWGKKSNVKFTIRTVWSERRRFTVELSLVLALHRRQFQLFIHICRISDHRLLTTCCCSKGSAPYWSNPSFLISDIQALWRSALSARVPECQKLKMLS